MKEKEQEQDQVIDKMAMQPERHLGALGFCLCRDHGAYIVGSAALWLIGELGPGEMPGDIDIVLPPEHFYKASPLFPPEAETNALGGIRIERAGGALAFDIWPQPIEVYLSNVPATMPWVAYNPVTGVLLRRHA